MGRHEREIRQRLWRCRHLHVEEGNLRGGYSTKEYLLMLTDIHRHGRRQVGPLLPSSKHHEDTGLWGGTVFPGEFVGGSIRGRTHSHNTPLSEEWSSPTGGDHPLELTVQLGEGYPWGDEGR